MYKKGTKITKAYPGIQLAIYSSWKREEKTDEEII